VSENESPRPGVGGVTMRSLILTAVLGLGTLGLLGALPTEAKAYPPQFYMNTFQVGPYSQTLALNNPYYSYYVRPYGAGVTYASPASMRAYTNPTGFGVMYSTRGMATTYISPIYGLNYYLSTPSYMGYSYSPYTGYRRYYVPGTSYNVPVDTSSSFGGYYNSYVPTGYTLP
jgi:hypothetical protein